MPGERGRTPGGAANIGSKRLESLVQAGLNGRQVRCLTDLLPKACRRLLFRSRMSWLRRMPWQPSEGSDCLTVAVKTSVSISCPFSKRRHFTKQTRHMMFDRARPRARGRPIFIYYRYCSTKRRNIGKESEPWRGNSTQDHRIYLPLRAIADYQCCFAVLPDSGNCEDHLLRTLVTTLLLRSISPRQFGV